MNDVFEKYRKYYQKKGGQNVSLTITNIETSRLDESVSPLFSDETQEALFTPTEITEEMQEDAGQMIRELMAQEATIRNQREKYRMNFYKLEAQQADREDFIKNYRIIKSLTEQLAPIYIQRRKIETTGRIEVIKQITQDEENEIRRMKYDKKLLIGQKSKLQSKISNNLSFAKGPQLVSKWEVEKAEVELKIYELDEQIRKIQEA